MTIRPGPPNPQADDARWLAEAVEAATANVAAGGGPFGAVVVRAGAIIGRGVNRVTTNLDPTAHAEVLAIRDACRAVGDFRLDGATVYASCAPCPLCLAACLWARVGGIVHAASEADAADAGFDDRAFRELCRRPTSTWPIPVRQLDVVGGGAPFEAWQARTDKVPY
jgi:tRNA(Arg) A34 adenosine deaminase TadA